MLLLAEVDDAHERLSGKATAATFKQEYELFGKEEFDRLSNISLLTCTAYGKAPSSV